MSLANLIRKATKVAAVSLGDLRETNPVSSQGSFTINAETETVSSSPTVNNIKMLSYNFREDEVDGDKILKTDLKAFVHVDDVPVGFEFSSNDTVTINSIVYEIFQFKMDPTKSVWFLHLRAS